MFNVKNFSKAGKFPRNFILAIQHILHPCTLGCFSGLVHSSALLCQKFCPACPFPDQNLALLAIYLARIWLSFSPRYISALATFFFKKSLPFFVFMLAVISFHFILFLIFFLISCSALSALPNNILQIFVYHYLRIINDTFIHCTNISLLQ